MADAKVEHRARPLMSLARNFRRAGDAAKAAATHGVPVQAVLAAAAAVLRQGGAS